MVALPGADGRGGGKARTDGREYKLPELPHLSVDGFCPETNTVFGF